MGGVYDMLDMEWEYSPKLSVLNPIALKTCTMKILLNFSERSGRKCLMLSLRFISTMNLPQKRTGYLRGEVIVESWTETSLLVRFDTLPPLKRKLEADLEEALQAMSVNT